MNKKGAMGEGVLMMYRLMLVAFIAFIILGVSSVFYAHYIDVRDAEARILVRGIVGCIAGDGVLDLDSFGDEGILSQCGFDESESERFFVRVVVSNSSGKVGELKQGDSGALWVRQIYEDKDSLGEGLNKYEPGYFEDEYSVYVLKDEVRSEGKIKVEALVSDEF